MKIDKIFIEDIKKLRRTMTLLILFFGIMLTALGLWRGLYEIDPKYFVLIASLVGLLISGFAISGKLFQDKKSSTTQKEILDASLANLNKASLTLQKATDNFVLTQQVELTTTEINEIGKLNSNRLSLLKEQNLKLLNLNKVIDTNIQLLNEINESQTKMLSSISDNITGGKTYCKLQYFFNPSNNQPFFLLRTVGDNPLRNVQLTIQDIGRRPYIQNNLTNKNEVHNYSNQIWNTTTENIFYQILYSKSGISIPIITENGQNDIEVLVIISLESGQIIQELKVKNFKDDLYKKLTYTIKKNNEILEEQK